MYQFCVSVMMVHVSGQIIYHELFPHKKTLNFAYTNDM